MTDDLQTLLSGDGAAEAVLDDLMPALCAALDCDRCVLFLRDPHTGRSRATHAWQRRPEFALAREDCGWQPPSPTLEQDDPMFAEALRNPAALFIEDVLSADPAEVNRDYEIELFKHRALVHAPIYHDGLMYGVLEPSVIDAARVWSAADRDIVAWVQEKIASLAADYVTRHCR